MEDNKNLVDRIYQANKQYIHRKVADMDVLISVGENIANFNGYVQMNQSAVCLWETLQEECEISRLEEALEQQFEITHEQAEEDVAEFIQILLAHGMVVIK